MPNDELVRALSNRKVPEALAQQKAPVPPRAAQPGLVTVGKSGKLAKRARKTLGWILGPGGSATTGAAASTVSKTVRKGFPWLVGGSVAFEMARQIWIGVENGKIVNDKKEILSGLDEACLSLEDIMSDITQVKPLIKDLRALKGAKDDDIPNSTFFKRFTSADCYSLSEEGQVYVGAYVSRRLMTGVDFIFSQPGLSAMWFNAIYLSLFDPETGLIVRPADNDVPDTDLKKMLDEIAASVADDTSVFEGARQLADLDAWLKYTEFVQRLREQGRAREDLMVGIDLEREGGGRLLTHF